MKSAQASGLFYSYLLPHFIALLLLLESNHFVDLEPELADLPRELPSCFFQGHDLILRAFRKKKRTKRTKRKKRRRRDKKWRLMVEVDGCGGRVNG